MQPIQKFSDFQSKKTEAAQAIKEADLQKEYGEVFVSLLKKYGVSSPADLDDAKKKEFFDELGGYYKAGEGQTDKGEELVDKEGGKAPVKEEEEGEGEEDKEEEEIIGSIASSVGEEEDKEEDKEEAPAAEETPAEEAPAEEEKEKEEDSEVAEDTAEDIEKEKVAQGEPDAAKGEAPKQEDEVTPAADTEEDPEAGKAAEIAPDEETAKDIEKEKVDAGKPEKVVMDFDSFVKSNFGPKN
jgi:hypothetical protein